MLLVTGWFVGFPLWGANNRGSLEFQGFPRSAKVLLLFDEGEIAVVNRRAPQQLGRWRRKREGGPA